jgi:rubredoxin
MDTQVWKFKCRSCGEIFEVETGAGQNSVDLAKQKPCPLCSAEPGSIDNPWHQVVGFQSRRAAPYKM